MQFAQSLIQVFRWTARFIGMLILAFVVLQVVSEGLPSVGNITFPKGFLWAGFVLSLVGFVLLWKWELVGGVVALGGIVLFYAANFSLSGKLPGGWVFPLFFLPGLLSIICRVTKRQPNSSTR